MHELIGIAGASGSGKSKFSTGLRKNVDQSRLARRLGGAEGIAVVDIEYSDAILDVANMWVPQLPASLEQHGIHNISALSSLPRTRLMAVANTWIDSLTQNILGKKNKPELAHLRLDPDAEDQSMNDRLLGYMRDVPNLTFPIKRSYKENKFQHQAVVSWLGKRIADLTPNLWNEETADRINTAITDNEHAFITVGGLRFPHNSGQIRSMGGTVVEVRYPHPWVERTALIQVTDVDPDYVVLNTGTFNQLELAAEVFHDSSSPRVIFTRDLYVTK